MKLDTQALGRGIAALIKEQLAPLKAANEKLLADNAALTARLASLEAEQTSIAGGLAAATVRSAIIDRDGRLVLTFGDGGTKDVGTVVGRDADAAQIRAAVITDVLAAMPKPPAGDGLAAEDFRPMLARLVDDAVTKAVSALPSPRDGNSVTPEDVRPMLASLVDDAVARLPAPQPGKDADPEAVRALVASEVKAAVSALPLPRDGNSVTPEDVRPMIDEMVQKRLDAFHVPDPEPGFVEAAVDQDGQLLITRSDGKVLKAGRVRGDDGLSLDDLEVQTEDGGRTLLLRLKGRDREIERKLTTSIVIDRGVWHPGAYKAGDAVTLRGSWWVAGRETEGKPGEDNSGWRLAVKRGSDTRGPSHTRGRAA